MDINYKGYDLRPDPYHGWFWHKLDIHDNPTPNGEWGLAPTMEKAMAQIDNQLTDDEVKRWSEPYRPKATAFGLVNPRGEKGEVDGG